MKIYLKSWYYFYSNTLFNRFNISITTCTVEYYEMFQSNSFNGNELVLSNVDLFIFIEETFLNKRNLKLFVSDARMIKVY